MTHLEKLCRDLAPQLGLPVAEVERICRYQFCYVAEQLATGEYPAVRLPRLGSFQPIPARIARKQLADLKKQLQDLGLPTAQP